MITIEPSVELLWITPEPEKQIELAGRTCYKSENLITSNSSTKFVQQMYDSGHYAMLEHASASFRVITDRGITHEIVRHRIASYAQESTRYCNYSTKKFGNQVVFIKPPQMSEDASMIWTEFCHDIEKAYLKMLKVGCSPQIARSVLPNCGKTEIVMTYNVREWIHFIKLRTAITAHPQIRPIAFMIKSELERYIPLFKQIIG